jgi:alanine racemase
MCKTTDVQADIRVELSQSAFLHNIQAIRAKAGSRGFIAVLKANAYGHGLREILPLLLPYTNIFAISEMWEAECIRSKAPSARIVLLSPLRLRDLANAVAWNLEICLSQREEIQHLSTALLANPGMQLGVHAKVDVGMGRLGCTEVESADLLSGIAHSPGLRLRGVMTHFPKADEDLVETQQQADRFRAWVQKNRSRFPSDICIHSSNSAASFQGIFTEDTHLRVGLALYGESPGPQYDWNLRPVLTWKSVVSLLRSLPAGAQVSYGSVFTCQQKTHVAIVPIGYADGYPRALSERAQVLIRGIRCPVIGRVTMNLIMVDVTQLGDIQVGDEVVILGSQGELKISALDLAQQAGTIPWEIFTNIRGSFPRSVINS